MKTRYLISYEPQGVARAGRHALSVKVKRAGAQVRTRTEYWVNEPGEP
jgi:hypothetical protein